MGEKLVQCDNASTRLEQGKARAKLQQSVDTSWTNLEQGRARENVQAQRGQRLAGSLALRAANIFYSLTDRGLLHKINFLNYCTSTRQAYPMRTTSGVGSAPLLRLDSSTSSWQVNEEKKTNEKKNNKKVSHIINKGGLVDFRCVVLNYVRHDNRYTTTPTAKCAHKGRLLSCASTKQLVGFRAIEYLPYTYHTSA